jgi:hypothetical protein
MSSRGNEISPSFKRGRINSSSIDHLFISSFFTPDEKAYMILEQGDLGIIIQWIEEWLYALESGVNWDQESTSPTGVEGIVEGEGGDERWGQGCSRWRWVREGCIESIHHRIRLSSAFKVSVNIQAEESTISTSPERDNDSLD